MTQVKLVWSTPNGDNLVAYMARVSNPKNQNNDATAPKLISFLIRNKHWSPFEMVNACFEIECTRDISRQILRHRSFTFQEFSQRYSQAEMAENREARLQDHNNRQNSIVTDDQNIQKFWNETQDEVREFAYQKYIESLNSGVAKEQARALLPEGLTKTRLYMNGSLRSWIHFCQIRGSKETQSETQMIANRISYILKDEFPSVWEAVVKNEQ